MQVSIVKNGVNSGNITIRVIPVTIDQYKEQFNLETLPNHAKRILEQNDPAEGKWFYHCIPSYNGRTLTSSGFLLLLQEQYHCYAFLSILQPMTSAVMHKI